MERTSAVAEQAYVAELLGLGSAVNQLMATGWTKVAAQRVLDDVHDMETRYLNELCNGDCVEA